MRVWKSRAALGSLAVALLSLALMAPTAMAGNGNGGGQGQGGSHGQGHGKPDDAGRSRGNGQAKHERKEKKEKKEKPDKASKGAKTHGDDQDEDGQDSPIEPADDPAAAHGHGGLNFLASLACKDGGWQTLQDSDGAPFGNQGRCVSYAIHGGALEAIPVVTISFVPSAVVVDTCDATAVVSHFDPSTDYLGELTVDGVVSGVSAITTDALGDASVPLGSFAPDLVLALTVDGVSSGDTTVACPPDVEAP